MKKYSFTDEQLLNLINNTIIKKTDFKVEDFTGGGVQITSVYNNKVIKYKVYLTFGFDSKRNSKSWSEEIDEELFFIWQEALILKVKSLQIKKTGSLLSELNELMNCKKIEDKKIEDKKIEDRDSRSNDRITNSSRTLDDYDFFIDHLKKIAPIKSKVTKTKAGLEFYKSIKDKEKLVDDYLAHQKSKREFAVRITAFLEDYNSFVLPQQTISQKFSDKVQAGMGAVEAFLAKEEVCDVK